MIRLSVLARRLGIEPTRWSSALPLRHVFLLLVDGSLAVACFWLAMVLRFEGSIPEFYRITLSHLAFLVGCCRVLANTLTKLHRWSFRFSGLSDGARVGLAGLTGTGFFLSALYLVRVPGTPRSVVVLELLLSTAAMAAIRFGPRLAGMYAADWSRQRSKSVRRTLIVGAGAAGEMLLRDLQRSGDHDYQVVGFADDDPVKAGMIVGGKRVLGRIADLPDIVRSSGIEQVLIAIPRLEGRRIREILSLCADLKLRFKILPVSFVYLHDHAAASVMMQDLSPDDLLMRDPVSFGREDIDVDLSDRTCIVTGAAGSIGGEICRQLLHAGLRDLVMTDIGENGLYMLSERLRREFPAASVTVRVADIRDDRKIRALFERHRPRDVFHAAAHKHVPLMESAPCEAVKNNVLGTRIVAGAAAECGAERMVYISTDKAVRPTSVMGATKRLGEEIVRSMAGRSKTRYCAVRFGNVLGSAGSVVPVFREQIGAGGPVTVTHPDVRRFFMTPPEAVALVLRAAYGDYGALCILDMGEQIRIVDLARHMITMSGLVPDVDVPITFTGLRPGEKLFEELLTEEEESTHEVNDRIFVAECPPAGDDLDDRVADLVAAANAELDDRVLELLHVIIPSYKRHGLTAVEDGRGSGASATASR